MSLPTFEELGITKFQLALGFAEYWAGKLRYVVEWKCWMFLEGDTWKYDQVLRATEEVKIFMRGKHTSGERQAVSSQLGNWGPMKSVEIQARSEPLLRVTSSIFGPEDKFEPPIRVQMQIKRMENRIRRVMKTVGPEGISEKELKRRCGVKK